MSDLINIQTILLDYILAHNWNDYKSYANKTSKIILNKQPITKEELVKIIQRSSSDFFFFNEISKKLFIKYMPIDEILTEISEIAPTRDKIDVLYLASNPKETVTLRLDEEIREIDEAIRSGEYRSSIKVNQAWAVRISDLQKLLLRFKPNIVHFSGHGSIASEIILEDRNGNAVSVPPSALSNLFRLCSDYTSLVILNACYSKAQAMAISQHIDWVIGMSNTISDEAAIAFSTAFYRALSYGKSIQEAHEFGINQIALYNLGEEETPQIIKKMD